MNKHKEQAKKKIKAAIEKMVKAARELVEAEQEYDNRDPKNQKFDDKIRVMLKELFNN